MIFLLVGLMSSSILFSQSIKIPKECKVVVEGLGGNIEHNTVGNKGIITMPDPYNGGDFSVENLSEKCKILNWELLGDISIKVPITNLSDNPNNKAEGNALSLVIQSYNKKATEKEKVFPLSQNLARSKGKVIINYLEEGKSKQLEFEIFKTYIPIINKKKQIINLPIIKGPDCLDAGKSCTYWVEPVASDNENDNIGVDQYYWSGLPQGCSILGMSNNNSTISFQTMPSTSSFILQCCLGRANAWDGGEGPLKMNNVCTTCVTKTIGFKPAPPYIIYKNNNGIYPITTFTLEKDTTTLEFSYFSQNKCEWTCSDKEWTINKSTKIGNMSTVIVSIPNKKSGQLTLEVSNGICPSTFFNYQIEINQK